MIHTPAALGASTMPEIKIYHPSVTCKFSEEVTKQSALELRNHIRQHLTTMGLDAVVAYSDVEHAIRVTVKSLERMIEYASEIHTSIVMWTGAPDIDSKVTKAGRTIRW
jgi:hypothetical protein